MARVAIMSLQGTRNAHPCWIHACVEMYLLYHLVDLDGVDLLERLSFHLEGAASQQL